MRGISVNTFLFDSIHICEKRITDCNASSNVVINLLENIKFLKWICQEKREYISKLRNIQTQYVELHSQQYGACGPKGFTLSVKECKRVNLSFFRHALFHCNKTI